MVMKKVKDYMNKKVLYLKPDDTILDAAKLFCKNRISGAPIVEDGRTKKLVGIISETDLVDFMGPNICPQPLFGDFAHLSLSMTLVNIVHMTKRQMGMKEDIEKLVQTEIENIMHRNVITITADSSVYDAAKKMEMNDVNRLPVVKDDRSKKMVGIITRADVIRSLIE